MSERRDEPMPPDVPEASAWRPAQPAPIDPSAWAREVQKLRDAVDGFARLKAIEAELREQASGSQDGYLLDVANRMREALASL